MAKENNNKSFVLRIDAATMDALELWAADEFRSINGQLQWIIADALRRSGRLKKPRAAAGATLPAADTGVASSGRDFPPAPAAVSPAVAAAPPADVASGESTPRCRMPSLPLPLRQPGRPARCLRTPVCSPTTRKKIKPI